MNRRAGGLLLLTLTLMACGHTRGKAEAEPVQKSCPDGAQLVGESPPQGLSQTCMNADKTPHGPATTWHQNGQIKEQGTYQNGHRHGEWRYWYDNGQIWMQENYEMGKKNGLMMGWYKNGKKSIQQYWKNDRKNGSHLMWYSNGVKKEEGAMSDGKEVGRWIYYTDDGNVDKVLDHD